MVECNICPNRVDTIASHLHFQERIQESRGELSPISMFNSTYKIRTAIIQKRLSDGLDKHLQETQYGFSRKRRTAQALHYVGRAVEKGERTRANSSMHASVKCLFNVSEDVLHAKHASSKPENTRWRRNSRLLLSSATQSNQF